jgi:hypothetical protein
MAADSCTRCTRDQLCPDCLARMLRWLAVRLAHSRRAQALLLGHYARLTPACQALLQDSMPF